LALFDPSKACEPEGDLRWVSIKNFCSAYLPEAILPAIKETYENGDLVLYGVEFAIISQLLPTNGPNDMRSMDLINEEFLHTCQFVVHKCKESGQLYLNPEIPDTSVFETPNFDNKEVAEKMIDHVYTKTMKDFIDGLGQFSTRYAYSKTATKATKWILSHEEELKKMERNDIKIDSIKEPITKQKSIVVTIEGSSGGEETVIIGAHLDSIANMDSGEMNANKPAPGLDDDGSGLMVLYEILRVIIETGYKPEKNVQIHAYASEELGLLGSDQIANDYKSEGMKVIGMLNVDGVGYKGDIMPFDIAFTKDFSNIEHADFLGALTNEYLGLSYFYFTCGHPCADHASWYLQGYPSTLVTESNGNPNYHTKNDDFVDVDYAANFAKLGLAYLAELAKGTTELS